MKKPSLDFLFGLSSLIGLIFTVIVTIISIQEGAFSGSSKSVIAALAFVNVILAVILISISRKSNLLFLIKENKSFKLRRVKRSLKKKNEQFFITCEIIHNIQDQFRDRVFELFDNYKQQVKNTANKEESPEIVLQNFRRTNEMFHLFLIDNIKDLFETITNDRCSVCIKILIEDEIEKEIFVRTYIRDSNSYRSRKSSDIKIYDYPYYENTAFKTILSPDNSCSHYSSDDLKNESTYVNYNPSWNKLYNATLVTPIRLKVGSPPMDYSVLGFICIDNKKGGLNNLASINLLASISDSLYNHFVLLNALLNELEEKINSVNESEK